MKNKESIKKILKEFEEELSLKNDMVLMRDIMYFLNKLKPLTNKDKFFIMESLRRLYFMRLGSPKDKR